MLYNFASEIKTHNKMKSYIAYLRTSTTRQNLGLEAQAAQVKNYCEAQGAELIALYAEQESGKNNQREELAKALEHCKKAGAVLLIAKLDRLSRDVEFLFHLRNSGAEICALDVPELNTLTLGIFATIAQHERELISQRTKAALAAKRAQCVKLGAPNPSFTDEQREKAAEARRKQAKSNDNNRRAACALKGIAGTLQAKAEYLNNNGFRTSRGAMFTPMQVSRLQKMFAC